MGALMRPSSMSKDFPRLEYRADAIINVVICSLFNFVYTYLILLGEFLSLHFRKTREASLCTFNKRPAYFAYFSRLRR